MRLTSLWLVLVPLTLAACAPRVSKKGPQSAVAASSSSHTTAAGKSAAAASRATASRSPAVAPAAQPAPAPVAAAPAPAEAPPPAWKPAAAPPAAEEHASAAPAGEDEADEAPAAPAKAVKRTYYGYSEPEIAALRKQSSEFKKLEAQLKTCTDKSTEAIERREEIPVEIARIRMSKGGLNPQKEKKIEKLKAEQAKLKSADHGQCAPFEDKLTAMLQSTYDSESALY